MPFQTSSFACICFGAERWATLGVALWPHPGAAGRCGLCRFAELRVPLEQATVPAQEAVPSDASGVYPLQGNGLAPAP